MYLTPKIADAIWAHRSPSRRAQTSLQLQKAKLTNQLTSLDRRLNAQFGKLFEHAETARFYWYDHVRKNGLDRTNTILREDPGAIFLLTHAAFFKLRLLEPLGWVHFMTQNLVQTSERWFYTQVELLFLEAITDNDLAYALTRDVRTEARD